MEKNSIEKIEEQVENIKNEEKNVKEDLSLNPDEKEDFFDQTDEVIEEDSLEVNHDITNNENMDDSSLEEKDSSSDDVVESSFSENDSTATEVDKEESSTLEKKKEVKENSNSKKEKVESKEDKAVKENNIVFWILIGCAVLTTIVVILMIAFPNKQKSSTLTSSQKKKIIYKYGKKLEEGIELYYQQFEILLTYEDITKMVDFDYDVVCDDHRIYQDGKVYIAKCSINQEEVDYTYGEIQKEEEDAEFEESNDAIKVYVSKDTHKATLDEPNNINFYEVYEFSITQSYTNLCLLEENSDYVSYYTYDGFNHIMNYKTQKEIKPHNNTAAVFPIHYNNQYDQNYVVFFDTDKPEDCNMRGSHCLKSYGVYSLIDKKIVADSYSYIGPLKTSNFLQFDVQAVDEGIIIASKEEDYRSYYGLMNYKNGKAIIPFKYESVADKNGCIVAINRDFSNTIYRVFDYQGNEPLKDKYDRILAVYSMDYIMVQQDGNVKLVNLKNEEHYNYKDAYASLNFNSFKRDNKIVFQFDRDYANSMDSCNQFVYDIDTKEGEVVTTECVVHYR